MIPAPVPDADRRVAAVALATLAVAALPLPAVGASTPTPTPVPAEDGPAAAPAAGSDATIAPADGVVPACGPTTATTPATTAPPGPTGGTDRPPNGSAGGPPDRTAAPDPLGTVTLITGHEVRVVERGDRRTYEVVAGGPLRRYETPRGTYLFPEGVDLDRFHPSLFNVDLLVDQGLGTGGDPVPVLVRFRSGAAATAGGVTGAATRRFGLSVRRTVASFGVAGAAVPADRAARTYDRLADARSVERVFPDLKLRVGPPGEASHRSGTETATLEEVAGYVGADDARREYGVTGDGVTVAVVDSGVDETHPAIAGDERAETAVARVGNETADLIGHGTHVAGIVTAEANASYRGIAPDAEILDVSVGRQRAFTSVVIDAMAYADRNGADVVSMSLGLPPRGPRSESPVVDAVERLAANDTLVVVAAGNSGDAYGTVQFPGVQAGVLTVGATGVEGAGVASFSSRGPTEYERGVKPDVVAPGTAVVSTTASQGEIVEGQGWAPLTGTSMATPVVSGAAALVLAARPELSTDEVATRLVGTADRLDGADVYAQGGGQVDVAAAIGTGIEVAPPTLDFGAVDRAARVTRTVVVHNDGPTARTVPVAASARAVRRGRDASGAVTTNVSELTVPAGGSAAFELTVDVAAGGGGTFAGRLRVGEHTTSFGWTDPYAVTVRKEPLAGGTVANDTVGFVVGESAPTTRFATLGADGVAEFHTTDPVVSAFSLGEAEGSGVPVHTGRTVELTGDATVVLDEADTGVVRFEGERIEAEVGPLRTLLGHSAFTSTRTVTRPTGTELVAEDPPSSVRFSRYGDGWRASVARVAVPASDLRGTADGAVVENGSEVFVPSVTLFGLRGDRTIAPSPSELRAVRVAVPRLGDDQRHELSFSPERGTAATRVGLAGAAPTVDLRGTALDDTFDLTVTGTNGTTGASWNRTVRDTYDTRDGGTVRVGVQPMVGRAFWSVGETRVAVSAAPQVTQSGGIHDGRTAVGTFEVGDRSVELEPDGPRLGAAIDASVEPGTPIRLRTRGVNAAHGLSTATNTTFEATYRPGEFGPPTLSAVEFANLRQHTQSIPSWDGTVLVRVTGENVSGLTAYVSDGGPPRPFESGGDGWTRATAARLPSDDALTHRIEFDAGRFAGGTVDLAVRATDDRGNSVRTVVRNAVRVVEAEDPGPVVLADRNGDGRIDDGELQAAIAAWVRGDLADAGLQRVIAAWVGGDLPDADG